MSIISKTICKTALCLVLIISFCTKTSAQNFDIDWLKQINPRYPDNQAWKTISSTAQPLAISIPIGMAAVALITDNKKLEINSYKAAISLGTAIVATGALKVLVNRPRPYETYPNDIYPDSYENGNSFPSAHVSMVFASATSVFLSYPKWYVGVPLLAWGTSVAYSRMYLGQHYPTDVMAGAVVGAGSAVLSHWLTKKVFKW